MKASAAIIVFLCLRPSFCGATDPARANNFPQLVSRCTPNAPLSTIRAIVRTESNFYPFALSINQPKQTRTRLKRQPRTLEEALYWSRWLIAHDYTVSAGLMQINIVDAEQHGYTLDQLFDSCTNLQLGWKMLTEKYQAPALKYGPGQRALREALSLYNSGSPRTGFTNGYVSHVIAGEFPGNPPAKKEISK